MNFKVGDRIEYIGTGMSIFKGQYGTIKEKASQLFDFRIDFDNFPNDKGAPVYEDELKLVKNEGILNIINNL